MAGESIAQGADIVKRSLRSVYDYMGMTMALSAIWFLIAFMPTALTFLVMLQVPAINSFVLFALAASLLLGPFTAATYGMASAMVRGEYVEIRDFLRKLRAHYKRAVQVTAALLLILAILVIDLIFFMNSGTAWMQYLSILWVYFIAFWVLVAQYAYAVLVRQDRKALDVIKVAALLALDNVVASLIVAVASVLVVVISLWLGVPLLLFLAGTLAFLHCTAFEIVVAKYDRSSGPDGPNERENNHD